MVASAAVIGSTVATAAARGAVAAAAAAVTAAEQAATTVATTAITVATAAIAGAAAIAAMTSHGDLALTADQGDADHREENRDAKNQSTIHPRSSKKLNRYVPKGLEHFAVISNHFAQPETAARLVPLYLQQTSRRKNRSAFALLSAFSD